MRCITALLVVLGLGLGILIATPGTAEQDSAASTAPPTQAQKQARPRLGLVLSGGGARGAAHIGVLQVLEELRVPVDIVAGTSMGAVTGGLYAAGLSPEEMSETLQQIDWVNAFEDKPGRQDLSFRRKQDDRTFLTNARLAFKNWRLFIPSGLVEGQKLDYLLRSLTLDREGTALIQDLPLEFRAVATDIETGQAVVFDRGALAIAQRASMSIPGAFSPVRIDDRVLVDGFVANNLPIDVAQAAGAEAIIAVDVGTPTSSAAELQSAVSISGQVSSLPVQAEQQRQIERLGPDDVLIRPALGDLSSSSFTEMREAIRIGREAALAAADRLSRHAVPEEEYAAWRETQRRPPVVLPVVDRIVIENNSLLSDRTIRASLRVRAGEPLDLELLGEDLGRLFGLDAFERVQFDLRRQDGEMVLSYRLDARERGTNYFRLGLNLETIFGDESNFTIGVNHVWYPANEWGGEVRSQAQFGQTSGVASGYYQPIDPREWFFVLPRVEFEATDQDIYVNDRRVARYDVEAVTPQLLLGANISNLAQLRAGIAYTNGQATRSIGDPTVFQSLNFSGGAWTAAFELDTLDDARFPTDGEYALVQALLFREELGFDQNVDELRTEVSIYRTFRGYTLGLLGRYYTSFNTTSRVDFLNSLGGFLNLSGFPRDSLVGRHVGLLSLRAYKSIATPSIFAWKFPVYLGGIVETGNAWRDRDDYDNLKWSVSPFVGAGTPLGPLYIAYAYGEGGEHQGYLYLGVPF